MARVNAWRQPLTGNAPATCNSKEWMHFCVQIPTGHLLINVNVTEEPACGRVPRLFVVASGEVPAGSVETFDEREVRGVPGQLECRLGNNVLDWVDGAFQLRLGTREIDAELRLVPNTLPTIPSRVALGSSRTLNWVMVPRLAATGWLRLRDQRWRLHNALAYHDHNWGDFRWGGELSWEWGYFHAHQPGPTWDVVVARISDGARHRTLSQAALLWRESRLVRVFQNHEIALTFMGSHRAEHPLTLPKIARLLVPERTAGLPSTFQLSARGLEASLDLEYHLGSAVRIALPSEVDPFRLVMLNETQGRAHIRGRVAGECFAFETGSMMEFVRG